MNSRSHILLVEDDPLVRAFLGMVLREAGHKVTPAACLREALAALVFLDIDLVLLDCVLPDGWPEPVISWGDRNGVAVLLMSGDVDCMTRSDEFGRPFLAKPFRLEELFRFLSLLLPAPAATSPAIGYLPRRRELKWHEAVAEIGEFTPTTKRLISAARFSAVQAHNVQRRSSELMRQTEIVRSRVVSSPRRDFRGRSDTRACTSPRFFPARCSGQATTARRVPCRKPGAIKTRCSTRRPRRAFPRATRRPAPA